MSQPPSATAPLVCHIVYRLDVGGLENGLVNLINRMPANKYRHAIVALTEITDFAKRIQVPGVATYSLHKRSGKDIACYGRLYRLLRRLRPDLVHTRNLGTLDGQVVAWAARVPVRVHGEHGWDVYDPQGREPRYVRLRRLVNPVVHNYIALSGEIEAWLANYIGVGSRKVTRICNGVDPQRFMPGSGAADPDTITIGTVTRFSEIKDPLAVVEAFIRLRNRVSGQSSRLRLLMVGDGPLRGAVEARICEAGITADVELAGNQTDVVPYLQRMDVFALGSRREGISNTILEAMACGLPVVATLTGGNPELVDEATTGRLVPPGDTEAMATALADLVLGPCVRRQASTAARRRVVEQFSMDAMAERYLELYDRLLEQKT